MTSTYKLHARPAFPHFGLDEFGLFGRPALRHGLTADSLATAIAGAAVRQLLPYNDGSYDLEIELTRQDHAQALNEIINALVAAGFRSAEAQVTEWTTSWVEGGLVGALGGGAIGGEVADVVGFLFGLAIGALVGAAGGSLQRKVTKVIGAQVDFYMQGGWQFTERVATLQQPNIRWSPAS